MAFSDIERTDQPHWLFKPGGFPFDKDGLQPDQDCCGCYKWGETFDCLNVNIGQTVDDSRLIMDWNFTADAWNLDPETTDADGGTDPSTYQVTWEWKLNPAGRFAWVPINSDWHNKLGSQWKLAHPGWLENGRQLCHGCPIDPPQFVGTPGQQVTYNCPSRKSLATSVQGASAHLKSTILGTGAYNAFAHVDNSGQPDRWRLRVTTAHYVEVDRDAAGNHAMTLRNQAGEIIATANPGGGAPWWRVSVDPTTGSVFVVNGIGTGMGVAGKSICAANLGTIYPQFGFETPQEFTGRLRVREVYLFHHARDKAGCPSTPECYDANCVWHHQEFDIIEGTVGEFAGWTGSVPVVNGQVRFPSGGGSITYTGSKPSKWHVTIGFDWSACPQNTRVTIRCGNWGLHVIKGKANAKMYRLQYGTTTYAESVVGIVNASETLTLSASNGMVSGGEYPSLPDLYNSGGLVYETTSLPTGNLVIETNGPVVLEYFSLQKAKDADPEPYQYCPPLNFNCVIAGYTWGWYLPGTAPTYLAVNTSGTWSVGPSNHHGWPSYGQAAITYAPGSTLSVPFNPALIPGNGYDDWQGTIHLYFPKFTQGVKFSITFGTATFTYYSGTGSGIQYNAAWEDVSHATITQAGQLKAIEVADWVYDWYPINFYYDASAGLLHVNGVTAAVSISDYVLSIKLDQTANAADYLGVGWIGYSKSDYNGCAGPPNPAPCCGNQPYPIFATVTVSGLEDTQQGVTGSQAINGVYQFDRAAAGSFIVPFDPGELRITDAVSYLDIRAITVECGTDDGGWRWLVIFHCEVQSAGRLEAGTIIYRWPFTGTQACPSVTMTPLVYGYWTETNLDQTLGLEVFMQWTNWTAATISLQVQ
jgi:hypothetical protein